jgi:hypothetical protein
MRTPFCKSVEISRGALRVTGTAKDFPRLTESRVAERLIDLRVRGLAGRAQAVLDAVPPITTSPGWDGRVS